MGLDVYIYRKPFYKNYTKSVDEVFNTINTTNNEKLISSIQQLYEYSVNNNIKFEDSLSNAIDSYISRNSTNNKYNMRDDMWLEEVAYFRKFWWIIEHFNYSDDNYDEDMEISKDEIEDVVEFAKNVILNVEDHFVKSGLIINKSPLTCKGPIDYYRKTVESFLSFKNSAVTDDVIDEANSICKSILNSNDLYLFYKVCYMYIQFKYILESTNWNSESIYLNANW